MRSSLAPLSWRLWDFFVLEVDDIGVVVVIDGNPSPAPIDGEGKVEGDDGDPLAPD